MTTRTQIALVLGLAGCGAHAGGGEHTPDASIGECEPTAAGTFTFEKIAIWADDARGAYSMIHDDMCGPSLEGIQNEAVPALAEVGLHAGLAPIVAECEKNGLWEVVAEAELDGNEIVSHSYTHPEITTANTAHEVVDAKAAFDAHTMRPVTFYVFPYDYFNADTIAAVGAAGHLGARACNRDDNDGFIAPPINSADPTNDLEIEFDVWPRNYSKYALYFPEEILTVHAYNAIEKGGWALREFHSVIADGSSPTEQGFGPIERSAYERHLQFLADAWKKGELWTATPSEVIRYRHARTACGASVASDTITFDTSNPDCAKFATPISVIVTTAEDLPRIDATQGGETLRTRKLGPNRFSVNADPTRGDVTLAGCSNPGYEVDPGLALTPKPTPAESVCLIETVTGTGSPGQMDDLERPPAEFQVLPNPAQGDGRTGSWSWYPQLASVSMQDDGGNGVLRYAGNGLGAWSGVTLAFLGGNGAGSCYDGTAYQGIRFRIRGTAPGTDELSGKVVVSLVTAETQSRNYGGDLVGEGGHFHKVVTLSPTWQTVSIAWTELDRPTWGATASLLSVAKTKLQAIDWGVSNATTAFEIQIDDVEMY
jgi:peptidoglycan/xylan/chitin deacetylase (PgdA/CDA1 family)